MAVLLLTTGDRLLLTDGVSGLLLAEQAVLETAGRVRTNVKADRVTVEVQAMSNPITEDTRVRVYGTFEVAPTSPSGSFTPTDPTAVTVTIQSPTGAQTSGTWTDTGAGTGYADFTPTTPGRWLVYLKGTGAVTATREIPVDVATPSTSPTP